MTDETVMGLLLGCGDDVRATVDAHMPAAHTDASSRVLDAAAPVSIASDDAGMDAALDASATDAAAQDAGPASTTLDGGMDAEAPDANLSGLDCLDDGTPVSCADRKLVPGDTFPMGRCGDTAAGCSDAFDGRDHELPEHEVGVSDFYLDTFEVTVGRYRAFLAAYGAGWRPAAGDGAHPRIAGSGWQQAWDSMLAPAAFSTTPCGAELDRQCDCLRPTFRDEPTYYEEHPINCVDWFSAFAFCAWDGGRLPTEAEWEYASAGGSDNRLYPWGSAFPERTRALFGGGAMVGRVDDRPLGRGRFGHYDLAGSMWEWVLDYFDPAFYTGAGQACTDCSFVDSDSCPILRSSRCTRTVRGGSWLNGNGDGGRAANRGDSVPVVKARDRGLRCARDAP